MASCEMWMMRKTALTGRENDLHSVYAQDEWNKEDETWVLGSRHWEALGCKALGNSRMKAPGSCLVGEQNQKSKGEVLTGFSAGSG